MTYVYEGGNDTLERFTNYDYLVISSPYTIQNQKGRMVINVTGVGTITINNNQLRGDDIRNHIVANVDYIPDNYITNHMKNTVVAGSEENDYITTQSDNVTVEAGAGNDFVRVKGINVMVDGGEGNDFVQNQSNNLAYVYSGGDDTIDRFGKYDFLVIGSDSYSIQREGDKVVVNVNGASSITINETALDNEAFRAHIVSNFEDVPRFRIRGNGDSNALINGSEGYDYINNGDEGRYSTLNGGAGDDIIRNYANDVEINAGAGDDSILNVSDGDGSADGSIGDGLNVSIDAGDGNDTIENQALNVTASGGEGNDLVINDGKGLAYIYTDGDDTIRNFHNSDTLVINGGYSIQYSASSVVVNVDGKGSIYLENCMTSSVKVVSDISEAQQVGIIRNNEGNKTVGGSGNDDFITSRGDNVSVDAGTGDDTVEVEGINVTVDGGEGNDFVRNWSENLAYVYTAGNDTIENFGDSATLVINGSYSIQYDEEDNPVVSVEGAGSITLRDFWGESVNIVSNISEALHLNFFTNSYNDTIITGTEFDDRIKNTGDRVTINALSGNNNIWNGAPSFGASFAGYGGGSGMFAVINAGGGSDLINNTGKNVSINAGDGDNTVNNNWIVNWNDYTQTEEYTSPDNVTINTGDGNDYIDNETGSNVLIRAGGGSDEIWSRWHSAQKGDAQRAVVPHDTTIDAGEGNDFIFTEGGKRVLVIGGGGSDTIRNEIIVYEQTNYQYRLAATDNTTLDGGDGDDQIYNESRKVSISGGAGNDYIENLSRFADDEDISPDKVTIDAGEGNDYIKNEGSNVKFIYSGGNDSIEGYGSDDTIQIMAGTVDEVKVNHGEVQIKVGNDTLTIVNFNWQENINLVDADGNEIEYERIDLDVINNHENDSVVTGTDDDDRIYNYGSNVSIDAGDGDDTIKNRGGLNVTVNSGAGNNSIANYNGNGKSYSNMAYVYSGGNDTIENFGKFDYLVLGDNSYSIESYDPHNPRPKAGNAVVVRVDGKGSITIKTGGKRLEDWEIESRIVSDIEDVPHFNLIENKNSNSVVSGSEGQDYISSRGNNVSINGGDGNDIIESRGLNITVDGGEGDDYLIGKATNTAYVYSGGDDSIENFGKFDYLVLEDDNYTIDSDDRNNTVVNVEGKGSITFNGNVKNLGARIVSDVNNVPRFTSISNELSNTVVSGDEGYDYISNEGDNVSINAGGSNNIIDNWGASSTIDGSGDGDDTINNYGANVLINGGEGNDNISNTYDAEDASFGNGLNVTINAGDGDDYIDNSGNSVLINAGEGNNNIYNVGSNVSINAGDGDDTIDNYGASVAINAGEGNNEIYNEGSNVSIDAGNGDDIINNNGASVTINADEGDNNIYNEGSNVSIRGGEGNDNISNIYDEDRQDNVASDNGLNVTIDAGDGDDHISNKGLATVSGGGGNDYVENYDVIALAYVYTDGDDTIENFTAGDYLVIDGEYSIDYSDDWFVTGGYPEATVNVEGAGSIVLEMCNSRTIKIVHSLDEITDNYIVNVISDTVVTGTNGNDNIYNNLDDVTIDSGEGDDFINNVWGENVSINAGEGNDYIENNGENVTIDAGNSNDTVENWGSNVSINTGEGHDFIEIREGSYNTIDAGTGNDTVNSWGSNISINAGDGDNTIEIREGSDNTIDSGMGNDRIRTFGKNNFIVYRGGNDIIEGHNSRYTIQITAGTIDEIKFRGDKVKIKVGNDTLTILDDSWQEDGNWQESINLVDAHGNGIEYDIIEPYDTSNEESDTVVEGTEDDDNIENWGNNVTINAYGGDDAIGNWGSSVAINAGLGDDTIENLGDSVSINAGDGSNQIRNYGNNATINVAEGDDTISLDSQVNIVTIENFGTGDEIHFDESIGKLTAIDGGIQAGGISILGLSVGGVKTDWQIDDDGNAKYHSVSLKGAVLNGEDDGNVISYFDTEDEIVPLELTGINSASAPEVEDDRVILSVNNFAGDNVEVTNNTSEYFFELQDGNYNGKTFTGTDYADSIENWGNSVAIDAGEGDNIIYNYEGSNVTINAYAGSDLIENSGGSNVSINAGDGDNTIHNYNRYEWDEELEEEVLVSKPNNVTINTGDGDNEISNDGDNVTINSGTGNDYLQNNDHHNTVYIYGGGNDTIDGLRDDTNYIVIENYSWSTLRAQDDDGNETHDVIVNVLDNEQVIGTITLRDYRSGRINIVDSREEVEPFNVIYNDDDGANIEGIDGKDYVENYAPNATIQTGNGNDEIRNNQKWSWNEDTEEDELISSPDNVSIDSGAGDDFIYNGGGSNVTINTGEGNDTVDNDGIYSIINTGAGDDEVQAGRHSTIDTGEDNDLVGGGSYSEIYLGDGDDTYDSWGSGENNIIEGGAGNDEIHNNGDNVTVSGGEDDDKIWNDGSNVSINAGGGSNQIWNYGNNATINVAEGDDNIFLGSQVSIVTIENFGAGDEIHLDEWIDELTAIDGGIQAGGVSILGLSVGGVKNDWQIDDDGNASYHSVSVKGATLNEEDGGDVISYSDAEEEIVLLELTGINSVSAPTVEDDKVIFSVNNFAGDIVEVTNNTSEYSFELQDGNYNGKTFTGTDGNDTIKNWGDSVAINAGGGDDYIENDGRYALIDGGTGHDSIVGYYHDSSISGGAGNDSINFEYGSNTTINGGTGNDYINMSLNRFFDEEDSTSVIEYAAGDGDDTIHVNAEPSFKGNTLNIKLTDIELADVELADVELDDSGEDILLRVGSNTLTIKDVRGERITVIDANGEKVTFGGRIELEPDDEDGKVYTAPTGGLRGYMIDNAQDYATITGSDNDDGINNSGESSEINGGAGNDYIYNSGSNVSIDGGGDNDKIENQGTNVLITGGDGDDNIENSGSNVTIDGGADKDEIWNYIANVSINGGADNDKIFNSGSKVTIDGGTGNDYIDNHSANVSINGGDGNDDILNWSDNVSIDAGDGDDTIRNQGSNAIIDGGGGNDKIENIGSNVIINGGEGDDIIENYFNENITVEGGTGDDVIYNYSANFVFKYNVGDGNDTIEGFREDSKLSFAAGTKYTIDEDEYGNVIITVGEDENLGTITLVETVADKVNVENVEWKHNGKTDSQAQAIYYVNGEALVTVTGLSDTVGIDVAGESVILTDVALSNRTTTTITLTNADGEDYKFALADNHTVKTSKDAALTAQATLTASGENHVYSTATYGEWYSVDERAITYNEAEAATNYTISGLSSAAKLNENVTVDSGDKLTFNFASAALNKQNVTFGGADVAVSLAGDVDTIKESIAESKTLTDGTLNYTAAGTGDYYTATNNGVTYNAQVGGETFTLSGINSADGVTINNYTVTVNESALDMTSTTAYTVKLEGNAYTLNFTASQKVEPESATLVNGVYTAGYVAAHFTKDNDKQYTFVTAETSKTFTISGLDNTKAKLGENVRVEDGKVIIGASALTSTHEDISVSDNTYTIELDNAALISDIEFDFTENNGVYSVTLDGSNAGYISDGNDGYKWQDKLHGETFTISGLASGVTLTANMFTYDGGEIVFTPSDELLPENLYDGAELTISSGKINTDNLTTTNTIGEHWSGTTWISDKTASIWTSGASTVKYTAATGGESLFSLSGVNSTTGFEVSKSGDAYTVKVTDAAVSSLTQATTIELNPQNSTEVSFAFAENFTGNKIQTVASAANLEDGTYTSSTYAAWSKIEDGKLIFTPATTSKTFTISGLSNSAELGNNIFVTDGDTTGFKFKAAALGKENVTITPATATDKFSVELDGVKTTSDPISESKTLTDGTLNYTAAGTGDYYTATNNGVTYNAQVGGETFTLSGINSADGVTINNYTVTVNESALDMTSTTAYTVKLEGNAYTLNFTASQKVEPESATLVNGVYTAGYVAAHFTKDNDKQYTFVTAETSKTFTISGLDNTKAKLGENVKVEDGKVIIGASALTSTHEDISVSDNTYTIELDNAALISDIEFDFMENSGVYSVTLDGSNAGYISDGNGGYTWQDKLHGETFTINGLASGLTLTKEMFTYDGDEIVFTPSDELLPENLYDGAELTISSGKINTANLTTTDKVDAHWKSKTEATWISDKTASSWTSGASTVKYTAATGGKELFTISGLSNTTNMTVDANVINLTAANLNNESVTVDKTNYTFNLTGEYDTPQATDEHWSGTIYKSASNTAGYEVKGNTIEYTAEVVEKNLFDLSGVESADGFEVSKSGDAYTVKVTDAAVSSLTQETTIELTAQNNTAVSLAFAENFTGNTEQKLGGLATLENGIYTSRSYAAYSTIDGTKLTFTPATPPKTFTITGLSKSAELNENIFVTDDGETTKFRFKAAALGKEDVTITPKTATDKFSIELDGVKINPTVTMPITTFKNSTLNYTADAFSEYYTPDNASNIQKLTYNVAKGGESFTLSGITKDSGVTINNYTVTVNESALKTDSNKAYTVKLEGDAKFNLEFKGSTTGSETPPTLTKDGDAYTYTAAQSSSYFTKISDNEYTFNPATKSDTTFTISGLNIDADSYSGEDINNYLTITNSAVLVKVEAIGNLSEYTGEGITLITLTGTTKKLELDDALKLTSDKAHAAKFELDETSVNGEVATFKFTGAYTEAYFKADGTFVKATTPTEFSVTNLEANSDVDALLNQLSGTTLTLTSDFLTNDKDKTVTISDGYKLAIPEEIASKTIGQGWSTLVDGTADYYVTEFQTAGYELKDNKLTYIAEETPETFTIRGVKTTYDIDVDPNEKTVTLKNANLNKQTVKIISGDYKLALEKDVAEPVTTPAQFYGTTYKSESKTAGYTLANNEITYTEAVVEQDLFSLSGVKTTEGITVENNVVMLTNANLNKQDVTISDGYKLKLSDDVPISEKPTSDNWTTVESGTATYTTKSTSDYYTLDGNKITYTAATGGKKIKISGLRETATLDDLGAITVKKDDNGKYSITFNNKEILNAVSPSISADSGIVYTVSVNDSLNPQTTGIDWNNKGQLLSSSTSDGYTVKDNQVVYTAPTIGSTLMELSNLASLAAISTPEEGIVTLDGLALTKKTSIKSNAGNYSVSLTGDMSDKTFTGSNESDSIIVAASNASVNGGAGDDFITISSGASNVTIDTKDGDDIISVAAGVKAFSVTNFTAGDQIKFSSEVENLNISDGKLVVDLVGDNQVTISGINSLDETASTWKLNGNVASYGTAKTKGANLSADSLTVGFGGTDSFGAAQIELAGVTSTEGFKVSNDIAKLNTAGFGNKPVTLKSNAGGYVFEIFGEGKGKTFVGTKDDENITLRSDGNTISAGDGDNTIESGANNSIVAGKGDDYITLSGANNTVNAGDGDNSIFGGANNSIVAGKGDDYITLSGDSNSINAGDGDNSIFGGASNKITVGKGDDYISLSGASNSINAGDGDNSIFGGASNSITAGKGDDYISLSGASNSINAGDGDNSIFGGASNSIVAGKGDDYISLSGANNTVSAGKGSNEIYISANNSINVSNGDDVINVAESVTAFSVTNFGVGDEIKFSEKISSITVEGGNLVATFEGDDSKVTISGVSLVSSDSWVTAKSAISYRTTKGATLGEDGYSIVYTKGTRNLFTITGLKDSVGVEVNGTEVTLTKDALDKLDKTKAATITISTGYTLKLADDENISTSPKQTATLTASGTTANYTGGWKEYYTQTNDQTITYTPAKSGELFTITNLDGAKNGDLSVSGTEVTISNREILSTNTKKPTTLTNKNNQHFTFAPLDDSITNSDERDKNIWTVAKSTATYSNGTPAHYTLDGDKITYSAAKAGTGTNVHFTLSNLKDNLTTSFNGKIDGISIDANNKVKLDESVLNGKSITLTNKNGADYKLALENAESLKSVTTPTVTVANGKATFQTQIKAGYAVDEDNPTTIKYTPAQKLTTVATVSGLKADFSDTTQFEFDTDNKTITIPVAALGDSKIELGKKDAYTLKLGRDGEVVPEVKQNGTAEIKKGTKNGEAIVESKTQGGYTLAANGKSITYTPEQTSTLATIKGLNPKFDVTKLKLDADNKTITIPKDALNGSNITISGDYGYTLKLGDGIVTEQPMPSDEKWSVNKNKTVATYTGNIADYYTTSEDGTSITYHKAQKNATLATISNLVNATTNDFSVSGNEITIAEKVLTSDKNKPTTLTNSNGQNFTFKELDAKLTDSTEKNIWTVTKVGSGKKATATATYSLETPAHYTCDDTTITYTAATAGDNAIIMLTGLSGDIKTNLDGTIDGINVSGKTVTLANKLVANNVALIGDDYTLALGNDVTNKSKLSVADWTITAPTKKNKLTDTTATLTQKTTKGYSVVDNTIKNLSKDATATLATITGLKSNVSKTQLLTETSDDNAVTAVKLTGDDLKTKVTVSGSVAFDFAADFSGTITGSKAADTISVAGVNVIVNAGAGDDSIFGGANKDKLYGEEGNDTLSGGAENDTLVGGKGDDSLWGGNGADTFIYSNGDGNDTICDFESNDLLEITGAFSGTFDDETKTLTLKVGKTENAITLTNVTEKTAFQINGSTYTIDNDNKLVN